MFIPIYLAALLCITTNVYSGDSLIHYPYAEEGLVCDELRADCTDFAKSMVRDVQRSHSVANIADNICECTFSICALGYLKHYCAPDIICDEACNTRIVVGSYWCCQSICFIRCVEECCERKSRKSWRWTLQLNQALKNWSESPTYRSLPPMLSAINIED